MHCYNPLEKDDDCCLWNCYQRCFGIVIAVVVIVNGESPTLSPTVCMIIIVNTDKASGLIIREIR